MFGMPSTGKPGAGPPPEAHRTMLGMPAGKGTPAKPGFVGKQTVIGMPSDDAAPALKPVSVGKQTMIGMPFGGDSQPHQRPAELGKRTMIGMVPSSDRLPPPAASWPGPPTRGEPGARQEFSAARTMLGVARPGVAPSQESPGSSGMPPPAAGSGVGDKRTMLGVARPGIAPEYPAAGQHSSGAHTDSPWQGDRSPSLEPHASETPRSFRQVWHEPRSPRIVVKTPPLHRRPAFLFVVSGVVVSVAALLIVLLWPTAAPIAAEAGADAAGADVLKLSCKSCPDGTILTVDGARGTTTGGVAIVPLARALAVGDNRFSVQINRPGGGRDESVGLVMPIAYRVRPNLALLQEGKPSFSIDVEAAPGASITIDGAGVVLGADGKGSVTVDVAAECAGANAENKAIERTFAYVVRLKGGKEAAGTVAVKVPIIALSVLSPKSRSVLVDANFYVAGRTLPNAVVEIEGTRFAAQADGRFSRQVQMKTVGVTELRITAMAASQAPRTIVFTVRRVADLEAEAKAFAALVTVSAATLLENADAQKGKPTALTGELFDLRQQGVERIMLLDVTGACSKPPCLVRLVDGGGPEVAKGARLRVFGYATGAYAPSGSKPVPEVEVSFLLPGKGRR